ncbi:MAG: DUF1295 domain-containing protein [Bacteroidota bacterium]
MTESLYYNLLYGWIICSIILLPVLLKVSAPYGRFVRTGWGPMINNKLGWILMESPALIAFSLFVFAGKDKLNYLVFGFVALWLFHYFNRVIIFPFRLKTRGKKMPLLIAIFALCFNLMNAFFNGYFFGNLSKGIYEGNICYFRIAIGMLFFIAGMFINWNADQTLIKLRKTGTDYKIPFGKLYKYISCPNYFGEMLEWTGFVFMVWNLPALSFLLWTIVNLLPRALSTHKWYQNHFPDYPQNRKALIPFIL